MHLYITFENGRTVDMGAQHPPYDAIGTSRALLVASDDVAYVEWRQPETDRASFAATRVSTARPHNGRPATFGWRSSTMPAYAFAELAA
jgi:hypothetical protein